MCLCEVEEGTVSVNDVDDAWRKSGLLNETCKPESGKRGDFGWLGTADEY